MRRIDEALAIAVVIGLQRSCGPRPADAGCRCAANRPRPCNPLTIWNHGSILFISNLSTMWRTASRLARLASRDERDDVHDALPCHLRARAKPFGFANQFFGDGAFDARQMDARMRAQHEQAIRRVPAEVDGDVD